MRTAAHSRGHDSELFAPRLLGSFCQKYPDINITLEVANRKNILDSMSQNADDLYLIGEPPKSSDLEFQSYMANPLVVIAPADHHMAGQKSIPLSAIAKEHFIIREQGSGTGIAVEQLFADAGYSTNVRMELGNNESIKQGVPGDLPLLLDSFYTEAGEYDPQLSLICLLFWY